MKGIRVTVARTAGSVPRDAGTQMVVWADRTEGTIGGGALEWQAMAWAREMLKTGATHRQETVPLGPGLGQCCGGSVTLDLVRADDLLEQQGAPLWIWGAGHVGRAIAHHCALLPDHTVTLIDTAHDRLPDPIPTGVTPLVATDLPRLAHHAPSMADHLVLTYSHDIDLALCHVLLQQNFASIGLIGSATKWMRFRNRLQALGHAPEHVSRIACPIGDPTLGKHPQAIAVGVAAALLRSGTCVSGDMVKDGAG